MALLRSIEPVAARAGHSRVIMHLDLDAFYCQVEIRRLGLDPSKPMAVQQWQGLIAVNYPARAAGISRHDRVEDALKKCPSLTLVHVETLDETGRARPNAARATDKVSLARYREASWEIFQILLRIAGDKAVEKASVDEAYVDVTAIVDRFLDTGRVGGSPGVGELFVPQAEPIVPVQGPPWPPAADAAPPPATPTHVREHTRVCALLTADTRAARAVAVMEEIAAHADWHVLSPEGAEVDKQCARADAGAYMRELSRALSPSLNADMRIAAGAVVASYVRERIFRELRFTCSCGVACNKMLAKLASARNKPSKQTLVPSASVAALMTKLPLQKIRFLGGKLGTQLLADVMRMRSDGAAATAASAGDDAASAAPADVSTEPPHRTEDAELDDDDDEADELEDDEAPEATDAGFRVVGQARAWRVADSGGQVQSIPDDITAGDAQRIPLSRLRTLFDDATAQWVYRIVRGVDDSEITPRLKPRGLLAAKSFDATACNSLDSATRWLRMLSAEIAQRLQADEVQWSRQPKTLVLYYRREGVWGEGCKSRSSPMPPKPRTADSLAHAAIALYKRVADEEGPSISSGTSKPFACTRLALAATGFIDFGAGSTSSITTFFSATPAPSTDANSALDAAQPQHDSTHDAVRKKPRIASIADMLQAGGAARPHVYVHAPAPAPVRRRGPLDAAFAQTPAMSNVRATSSDVVDLASSSDEDTPVT